MLFIFNKLFYIELTLKLSIIKTYKSSVDKKQAKMYKKMVACN